MKKLLPLILSLLILAGCTRYAASYAYVRSEVHGEPYRNVYYCSVDDIDLNSTTNIARFYSFKEASDYCEQLNNLTKSNFAQNSR